MRSHDYDREARIGSYPRAEADAPCTLSPVSAWIARHGASCMSFCHGAMNIKSLDTPLPLIHPCQNDDDEEEEEEEEEEDDLKYPRRRAK